MIKVVRLFSLPEGTDKEEFWKYHTEVHAADVAKHAKGLRKYVINRFTGDGSGEPEFFGMIEMWWENQEAKDAYSKIAKTMKVPSGLTILEDFMGRVIDRFGSQAEEREISLL